MGMNSCGGPCRLKRSTVLCLGFGVTAALFFGIGGAVPPILRSIVDAKGWEMLIVDSPQSAGYDQWVSNNMLGGAQEATYFKLYFFDVTNPDAVLTGSKPVVEERGPYSYRKYIERFNVTWNGDGSEITFRTQTYYVFDKYTSRRGLSENDKITNV